MHQRQLFKQSQQRVHAKQKTKHLLQERKMEMHRGPEHVPFHPEKRHEQAQHIDKRALFLLLIVILANVLPNTKMNSKVEKPSKSNRKNPTDTASVSSSDTQSNLNLQNVTSVASTEKTLTPLEKHVLIFTTVINGERVFTRESLAEGLKKLNATEVDSRRIAGNTLLGAYKGGAPHAELFSGKLEDLYSIHGGGYFTLHDIVKLIHPEDTGTYTKAGQFDEQAFQNLSKCAVKDPVSGKMALSLGQIKECKSHSGQEQRWPVTPPYSGYPLFSWAYDKADKAVSNSASHAEFDRLLDLMTKVADIEINGVKHISVDKLRKFYTEGDDFFADYAEQVRLEKAQSLSPSK